MPKHAKLSSQVMNLFDFAAMNPMEGPLMASQLALPAVMLQVMEQQEREIHRMGATLAADAEKAAQTHHEEKQSVSTEDSVSEQETSHTSFNLIYYNPETNNTEVIKEDVGISVSDYMAKEKQKPAKPEGAGSPAPSSAQVQGEAPNLYSPTPQEAAMTAMALDQSVGQKSTYPLYMNVATPLARSVVDPIKLEAALSRIEIESPKPFGGAAGMIVAPEVFARVEMQVRHEGIEEEVVALETLREVEVLREETVHQLDKEIKAFEHVIDEVEVTDTPVKKLVGELPLLSKERYLALLKHEKKIAETIIVDMLIADLEFLIVVKERVKGSGLRDLLNTLKKLGRTPVLSRIRKSGGGGGRDEDDESGSQKGKK